jgi:uncharacterized membrane protein YfcA
MEVLFPTSGVQTQLWLPPLVALILSFCTSMAGVSGAFLLLPFQMSVLGFTSPAVSPTNLIFNIVAIPGGVLRFIREGRMVWPLAGTMLLGTVPGVIAGGFVRLALLPDAQTFKFFVGVVLLYIGARLIEDVVRSRGAPAARAAATRPEDFNVRVEQFGLHVLRYRFGGEAHQCSPLVLGLMCLLIGVVGGVYGVGGGSIIAPYLVAVLRLPVHTIAGATLLSTFATSVVGVVFYQAVAPWYAGAGQPVAPDWLLGALFGVGGLLGIYLGARAQRFVRARWLKAMLSALILVVAARYIAGYVW